MNWEGYGSRRSWPHVTKYTGICQGRLVITRTTGLRAETWARDRPKANIAETCIIVWDAMLCMEPVRCELVFRLATRHTGDRWDGTCGSGKRDVTSTPLRSMNGIPTTDGATSKSSSAPLCPLNHISPLRTGLTNIYFNVIIPTTFRFWKRSIYERLREEKVWKPTFYRMQATCPSNLLGVKAPILLFRNT
jgi:hypothetical protein